MRNGARSLRLRFIHHYILGHTLCYRSHPRRSPGYLVCISCTYGSAS